MSNHMGSPEGGAAEPAGEDERSFAGRMNESIGHASATDALEPNAWTDPFTHPLWVAAVDCASESTSSEFASVLVGNGQPLQLWASCLVLVTTEGRMIVQKHRNGFQCFGGGKRSECLANRMHSVRREAWMEGNFDVSNSALVRLSSPVLVTQEKQHNPWGTGTCVLQFALLQDDQVVVDENRVVTIGGEQMHSRENARKQGYDELDSTPTAEHIHAGQFFGDEPTMWVVQLTDCWRQPSDWRPCDWISLVMTRDLLYEFIDGKDPASCSRCFGDTPDWYSSMCKSMMIFWDEHLRDIGKERWPLLTTSVLYTSWKDEKIRDDALAVQRGLKRKIAEPDL